METLIQLQFPKHLQPVQLRQRLPPSATYHMQYACCKHWQHASFSVIEQYYQTKDIYLYLGEVRTSVDLPITFHCSTAHVYWVYQMQDDYLLVIDHEHKKTKLKSTAKSYRAVYVPVGDHRGYFQKGGHYLIFYFSVDPDLLLRFQDTSLRFLKALLDRLAKEHATFAFSIQLPIDAQVLRHLNKLLHIRKLDALELEGEIPHVILRLIAIARVAFYKQQRHIRLEIEKLEEIRLFIKENLEIGNVYAVPHIAQQFEISPYHLRYSHKQAYGISLQGYMTDLRLKEVYRLIEIERLPPLQAAYAMGYNDIRSFRRQFIKHFDITPNELHKRLK